MNKNLVLTVGNDMMGDDAAGPLLARRLLESPLKGWDVLDGGNTPENVLFKIREGTPQRVIIVDAADMGIQTGGIRLIDKDQIGSGFLLTTHTLPLNYLIEAMNEFVPRVEMIGIQPDVVAFGYPVSDRVKQAVERVYSWLQGGAEGIASLQKDFEPILDGDSLPDDPEDVLKIKNLPLDK
jgi:hydrogenase 3 maturation protease